MYPFSHLEVSQAGRKRINPSENQDAVNYAEIENAQIIIVADGVSSAGSYAGIGAKIACSVVQNYLGKGFNEFWEDDQDNAKLKYLIWSECQRVINKFISNAGNRIKPLDSNNFATTILAAATKDNKIITLQVGNGSISAIINNQQSVIYPSVNLQNNSTVHISGSDFPELSLNIKVGKYFVPDDLQAIVLMSDGAEDKEGLYDESRHTLTKQFSEMYEKIENCEGASMAKSILTNTVIDISQKSSSQDDISIAMLYRKINKPRIVTKNLLVGYSLFIAQNELEVDKSMQRNRNASYKYLPDSEKTDRETAVPAPARNPGSGIEDKIVATASQHQSNLTPKHFYYLIFCLIGIFAAIIGFGVHQAFSIHKNTEHIYVIQKLLSTSSTEESSVNPVSSFPSSEGHIPDKSNIPSSASSELLSELSGNSSNALSLDSSSGLSSETSRTDSVNSSSSSSSPILYSRSDYE